MRNSNVLEVLVNHHCRKGK